ncbi:ribonuclease 3-like isoform X2 [Mya arenaria]|nr:ribonuclease 3-like isoform X2 [Mya arenaria]
MLTADMLTEQQQDKELSSGTDDCSSDSKKSSSSSLSSLFHETDTSQTLAIQLDGNDNVRTNQDEQNSNQPMEFALSSISQPERHYSSFSQLHPTEEFKNKIVQDWLSGIYTKLKSHVTNNYLRELSFMSPKPISFEMVEDLIDDMIEEEGKCYRELGDKMRKSSIFTQILSLKEANRKLNVDLNDTKENKNKLADQNVKLKEMCKNNTQENKMIEIEKQKLYSDTIAMNDNLAELQKEIKTLTQSKQEAESKLNETLKELEEAKIEIRDLKEDKLSCEHEIGQQGQQYKNTQRQSRPYWINHSCNKSSTSPATSPRRSSSVQQDNALAMHSNMSISGFTQSSPRNIQKGMKPKASSTYTDGQNPQSPFNTAQTGSKSNASAAYTIRKHQKTSSKTSQYGLRSNDTPTQTNTTPTILNETQQMNGQSRFFTRRAVQNGEMTEDDYKKEKCLDQTGKAVVSNNNREPYMPKQSEPKPLETPENDENDKFIEMTEKQTVMEVVSNNKRKPLTKKQSKPKPFAGLQIFGNSKK